MQSRGYSMCSVDTRHLSLLVANAVKVLQDQLYLVVRCFKDVFWLVLWCPANTSAIIGCQCAPAR